MLAKPIESCVVLWCNSMNVASAVFCVEWRGGSIWVLELKKEHPEVELIAVIPHRDFCKLFHGADAEQYRRVADASDGAEVVSENGGDLSYMLRNNYLVDNASVVVAWWNGVPKGGTAYTVRRARKSGVEMINLFPDLQLDLGF